MGEAGCYSRGGSVGEQRTFTGPGKNTRMVLEVWMVNFGLVSGTSTV